MRVPITARSIGIALATVAVFIGVSLLARHYEDFLRAIVGTGGAWGIAAFILLTAIFVIFLIPLDVSVLIPLAAAVWGPVPTALMSVAGWTLGSATAFFLARRFGAPTVGRLTGMRLRAAERAARRAIPKHHLFWWALAAQALLPIDLISYLFGLFADIGVGLYALATAIGDLLPGFFFAYAGVLPAWYQVGALVIGFAIAAILFWRSQATAD